VDGLEIDLGMAFRHDQPEPAFGVLEEEVLGMSTRDIAVQPVAFSDREYRVMLDGVGLNAKGFEALK
jgi:hypothetical protein